MEQYRKISWILSEDNARFEGIYKEKAAVAVEYAEGKLSVDLYYGGIFTDPLPLCAEAKTGDELTLTLRPYRVELYANGALWDENWPYGEDYPSKCSFSGDFISDEVISEEEKQLPCVLKTFTMEDGWLPAPGVFIGDCMPFVFEGRYHVLYLKDRRHHNSKWHKGAHQWAHISTEDFKTWQEHPMAVEIDDPAEGSICTGSWMYHEGMHYLYYTVRMCDGSPARICRSVSEDGYHFRKDKSFLFYLSEKYTGVSARDPKLVRDESGLFHMFITTSLSETGQGCLAHLTSSDLDTWKEEDTPLYLRPHGEPECSDYFTHGKWHYLVHDGVYEMSEAPFSGWQTPADPSLHCGNVPKAAEFNGEILFTGFAPTNGREYAGTLLFAKAEFSENGELRLHRFSPETCEN